MHLQFFGLVPSALLWHFEMLFWLQLTHVNLQSPPFNSSKFVGQYLAPNSRRTNQGQKRAAFDKFWNSETMNHKGRIQDSRNRFTVCDRGSHACKIIYICCHALSMQHNTTVSRIASEPQKSLKPKRDGKGENFDRLAKSLIGKCDQLRKKHQAGIYIIIRGRKKLLTYTSCNCSFWPRKDLCQNLELPAQCHLHQSQMKVRASRWARSENVINRREKAEMKWKRSRLQCKNMRPACETDLLHHN